jgi:hypothetical protein
VEQIVRYVSGWHAGLLFAKPLRNPEAWPGYRRGWPDEQRYKICSIRAIPRLFNSARRVVGSAYVQEQIQIIATAIGKPAVKAPTIIKVNAKSGFASERMLSTDMSLLHMDKSKNRHQTEGGDGSSRARVSRRSKG